MSNRTWTRTVNPNEPFHFGEPEPNLNQQNFTSVNLNQIWTLKIVLKWTQTEPEPLTKVRIYYAAGAGIRTKRAVVIINRISNFYFFFSGRNEKRQLNFKSMNPNRTWTSNILLEWTWTKPEPNLNQTWTWKMVLRWTQTKPEPLKYFEQELNLNPNRCLKRFDTL